MEHRALSPRRTRTDFFAAGTPQFQGAKLEDLATIEVIEDEISREEMRMLYSISNAFVLPTRGEGWGLPAMEAMAMELPAIITNYSGPATFVTPENGYPIKVASVHRNGQVRIRRERKTSGANFVCTSRLLMSLWFGRRNPQLSIPSD